MARPSARKSKLTHKVPVWLEHLYAVIPGICDDDVTLWINCHTLWPKKLSIPGALSAEKTGRLKVGMDDEQSVIVEISYYHVTFVVETHTSW